MSLTYAELCAGYGGLGLAIEEVMGAELKWYSEFDPAPSKIMAAHWPDAPNHGDMTKIDWAAVEPVDIISGGTPCQDLSHAGRRAGMTEGTRSNLWVQMREAIATIKPTYVVWENVRGAYSAGADSDLEPCPGCVGDPANGGPVLRALGRVLGDLSDLGFNVEWRGLRAADVGAPHGRFRVFILATHPGRVGRNETIQHDGRSEEASNRTSLPDQSDRQPMQSRSERGGDATAEDTMRGGSGRWPTIPGDGNGTRADTPTDRTGDRLGEPWTTGATAPSDAEITTNTGGQTGERGAGLRQIGPEGVGRGRLDHDPSQASRDWGIYTPAIRRWEAVRGTAPAPTELNTKGKHRLSAAFAEWMMGVPAGWITDPAIGISRNDQLKAAGNGVVPQQAAAALRDMLGASK